MPNRLVFPGGAVDAEDYEAPHARSLRPDVRQHLARDGGDKLADALGVAAARELEEETGLTLGQPPRLDRLDYLCRAVTPAAMPVRFDARFLVVEEDEVSGVLAGSGELEGLRYYPAAEALALDLVVATRGVLGKLLEWLDLDPEHRPHAWTPPLLVEREWQRD